MIAAAERAQAAPNIRRGPVSGTGSLGRAVRVRPSGIMGSLETSDENQMEESSRRSQSLRRVGKMEGTLSRNSTKA